MDSIGVSAAISKLVIYCRGKQQVTVPGMTEPNRIGTVIDNQYEILQLIGTGGMASVYKARHKQNGTTVAAKILHPAEMTPTDIERLRREARALNALIHPNILKCHSFGMLDSGEPYIILDLLEGMSLDQKIQHEGPQSPEWMVKAFRQICKGLAAAHEKGMIHRDLKPSNIMVVKEEADGSFVKLLDFGIVRSLNASKDDVKLTRSGEIFGSPLYMSPETIQGKEIDERADIYALGCLMYESLTASPPFLGGTVLATFMKHLQDKVKPMTQILPELIISLQLEKVIYKCMQKDPANRYQTVTEVLDALEGCED